MSNRRQENWQGMNWIRQEKRLAIHLRDGLACVYCGAGVEQGARIELDHVLPVGNSGANNNAENLVTACKQCNIAKGARQVAEFIRATAVYLNNGIKPIEIHRHLINCCARPLPLDQAKALIEARGSSAKALAALREKGFQ